VTGENSRYVQVAGNTVKLVGQLAISELRTVQKVLHDVVKEGHKVVILDLVHVDYMSSSYIGLIVAVAAELEKSGGAAQVKAQGQVLRLLQLAGVDKILKIEQCKTWGPPPV
jgi:anti-anti-sigma factor